MRVTDREGWTESESEGRRSWIVTEREGLTENERRGWEIMSLGVGE